MWRRLDGDEVGCVSSGRAAMEFQRPTSFRPSGGKIQFCENPFAAMAAPSIAAAPDGSRRAHGAIRVDEGQGSLDHFVLQKIREILEDPLERFIACYHSCHKCHEFFSNVVFSNFH